MGVGLGSEKGTGTGNGTGVDVLSKKVRTKVLVVDERDVIDLT